MTQPRPRRCADRRTDQRAERPFADAGGESRAASAYLAAQALGVNVAELRQRLGQRRVVDVELALEPPLVVVASQTLPQPVRGLLTVESIERGVTARGSVTFAWEGDCRRCLEPVTGEIEVDIDEIFQVDAPPDSDLIDFDGEEIDLLPVLRDAVGLSLPLAPLCRDDCAGPDPDRYPALTADKFAAARRPDPRWAVLDQLDLD